jgi:hypothetical protein
MRSCEKKKPAQKLSPQKKKRPPKSERAFPEVATYLVLVIP